MKKILIAIVCLLMLMPIFAYAPPVKAQTPSITGSYVKDVNGVPAIMVQYGEEERVLDDVMYITYSYSENNVKHMAENGTTTFGFMLNLGDSSPRWTDPVWTGKTGGGVNVYSNNLLDYRIQMTTRVCPDAKILIRFYVGVPLSWLAEHPEEYALTKNKNGELGNRYGEGSIADTNQNHPTLYSDVILAEMGRALEDTVRYLEELYGGNILGYTLSGLGSEEWYSIGWHGSAIDDYSPQAEEKFKIFLREKYGTDEALRTAWRKGNDFTFDNVRIPDPNRRLVFSGEMFRDPEKDMDIVDFFRFYNEHVPDTIISLAKSIKTACPNKIVGALYGYQMEFGSDLSSNHNALGKLVDSPYIDFVKIEGGRVYRIAGQGGDNYLGPLDTIRVAGKVTILDNDTITHRIPEADAYKGFSESQHKTIANGASGSNGATKNAEDAANIQKRFLGFAIANSFTTTFFDLHGGYYQDTYLRKAMADAESVYTQSFGSDRSSAAEILIVSDELSLCYTKVSNEGNPYLVNESNKTIRNLMFVGAPYDIVLTRDLAKIDLSQYKMILFFCPYHVSDEDLKCINLAKGGGRTLYFTYAPGLFYGANRTPERMSLVTGINIVSAGKKGVNKMTIEKSDEPFAAGYFIDYYNPFTDNTVATIDTKQTMELFTVNDPDAVIVGKNENLNVLAYKRMTGENGDYTTAYIPFAGFTEELLRAYARFAGVHIYTDVYKVDAAKDRYDNVNIGREYITIHANGTRERTLHFPKRVDVYDAISNELIQSDTDSVTLSMNNIETVMLHVLAAGTVPNFNVSVSESPPTSSAPESEPDLIPDSGSIGNYFIWIFVGAGAIVVLVGAVIFLLKKKK